MGRLVGDNCAGTGRREQRTRKERKGWKSRFNVNATNVND
jgi:hypothetical protein